MERQTEYVGVKMTPHERAKLESLAQESGRSRGAVMRRLLNLADLPQARELLGLRSEPGNDSRKAANHG